MDLNWIRVFKIYIRSSLLEGVIINRHSNDHCHSARKKSAFTLRQIRDKN